MGVYPGQMAGDNSGVPVTRVRDGATWRIGSAAEVDWIANGTSIGLTITSGIPPVFAAYATVVLLADTDEEQQANERALLAVLSDCSADQAWWLGYLDTSVADMVFPGAPRVSLYADWRYVLVEAGPEEAGSWRSGDAWKGVLPDLMFPTDRSWLVSTLWDDDWTCVGGPEELITGLLGHADLQDRGRRVTVDEDATPPGREAW